MEVGQGAIYSSMFKAIYIRNEGSYRNFSLSSILIQRDHSIFRRCLGRGKATSIGVYDSL